MEMAKNKNEVEAEELLDRTQEAMNIGDKAKAKDLLEGAERLFPTQKAKDLLRSLGKAGTKNSILRKATDFVLTAFVLAIMAFYYYEVAKENKFPFSLMSSFLPQEPLYSLEQTPLYTVRRATGDPAGKLKVMYYVKDTFIADQEKVKELEAEIEEQFIDYVIVECFKQGNFEEIRAGDKKFEFEIIIGTHGDEQKQEDKPYCAALRHIVKWKVRASYGLLK